MPTIKSIPEHIREHTQKATNNVHLKEQDAMCTCYRCHRYFAGHEITETVDAGQTVLCPFCHVDAVIPAVFKESRGKQVLYPGPDLVKEISNHMFSPA